MMKKIVMVLSLMVFWAATVSAAGNKPFVTLMTHDSFAVSQDLITKFEARYGATLKILKSGSTGAALNQAILSRNNPLADVFYGVDNSFMSRALRADIFDAYASPLLAKIPDRLKLDPQNRLLPVSFGDVCLNYDKNWFAGKQLAPPRGLEDLIRSEYRGLTVVQNPATSSPGLAFLLTTIGKFGEDGYLDYWKQLRANDVYISTGWSDAYYGQFTRAKGGTRPIVVSYASSPPAEVYYSKDKPEVSPTAAVLAPLSAFRQIQFTGVIKGTRKPELARNLVDFMLSPEFQQDIPLQMWCFPADPTATLPDVFRKHTRQAKDPVVLSPEAIENGREDWIEAWTDVVLR